MQQKEKRVIISSIEPRSGIRIRRSSAGLGLFTEEAIPKDTTILEYIGYRVPADSEATNKYIFNVSKRIDIDGSPRWNTMRYVNHSCRPNCDAINKRSKIFLVARRLIKPGEELTYHYGKGYFESEYIQKKGCLCQKCREGRSTKSRVKNNKTKSVKSAKS